MLKQITPSFYAYKGNNNDNKIFATDLDSTIIRTYKAQFPKDEFDYRFLPNRISVLKNYINKGYTIVIFTNQKRNSKIMILRIENILTDLIKEGINPWVFVAVKDDEYRKPGIGMWKYFEQNFEFDIDYEKSIFVGDAAGRPQDHSNSDLIFAENIGLQFYIPEEIFPNTKILIPDYQAMFIFVGMQGSGKSSYYEKNLKPRGWFHANQDKIGTYAKVLKEININLKNGKSVAVDATNPQFSKRQDYIKLAIQYQIPTLIVYFVNDGHAFNALRGEKKVPNVAYSTYYKNLEEPSEELDGVPVVEYM